jgi:photosystem II stability/assembly factor-like uncharacterized protein
VVGVSGYAGIYRMTADGQCAYFPFPLRTKFDNVYPDGRGNCWASYAGGVAYISNGKVQYFDAPLGLTGMQVLDAVHTNDGKMVFTAIIPNANWYVAGNDSAFLLVTDGQHWKRYGFEEGLPGQFTQFDSIGSINGQILFNTHAGIFRFLP